MDYLARCRSAARQAAAFYGWQPIACADETGALRDTQAIHRDIMAQIEKLL